MIKPSTLLQSHKTDLLLINEISRPSQIAQLQAPTNMIQLQNLLKFKNAKSFHSRREKQNAQAWLNREGIDISPLVERVHKAKEISMQKQEQKKIEEDCIFYIPNMSYKKIEQYEFKANEYATMSLIQHNMRNQKFSHKLINRINAKFSKTVKFTQPESFQQFPIKIHSSINTQPRSEEKRQNYLKCMNFWAKNSVRSDDELAGLFSQKINKKFWNIMANHIKCINQATDISQQKRTAELYMESLRMIEDEYKTGMPEPTLEALNYHLQKQFFGRLEKGQLQQIKYVKDSSFGAYWAKAFVLYRAGRRGQFYNLLALKNETQLLQAFREVDQSIQRRDPITKDVALRVEDIFYEQLMFALRGQSKYSSKIVANLESLDTVWVILRNLGIFYDCKKEEVDKSRKDLLEYYNNQQTLESDQLYNLFYLLAYDQIVSIGFSDIMDQDDFVHFMICLYSTPQLLKPNHQKFKPILKSQLLLYIKQLIAYNKPQFIYYMLFIPQDFRAAQISTILSSSNLVSSFDWLFLKNNIPSTAEFELIVSKTLEKYIIATNDYLSAAQKYIELIANGQKSVRCLLQFLIRNFSSNSYNNEAACRAQIACDKYIYQNPKLDPYYRNVLNFLIQSRKLLGLVRERNQREIHSLVNQSRYVMLGSSVPQKHFEFLKTLIELSETGLDVYFKYIKTVITGISIYFTRNNDDSQFVQFVSKITENAQLILTEQPFDQSAKRQETIDFFITANSFLTKSHY